MTSSKKRETSPNYDVTKNPNFNVNFKHFRSQVNSSGSQQNRWIARGFVQEFL